MRRAAGNALVANPIPIVVPCHRVVAPAAGWAARAERSQEVAVLELEGALGEDG